MPKSLEDSEDFKEPNVGFKALLGKWKTQDRGSTLGALDHVAGPAARRSTEDGSKSPQQEPPKTDKPKMSKSQKKKAFQFQNVYQQPLRNIDLFKPKTSIKNPIEKELILTALQKNFVFSDLSRESLQPLVAAFETCTFKHAGDVIIRQGDPGDYFYIIKSGSVLFEVHGKGVGKAGKGASFGELSLLYTCPRAATVIAATSPTELFRVDQNTFRYILQSQTQQSEREKIALLESVDFLKTLTSTDLEKLSSVMIPRVFQKDELLVKKGDMGDAFYVIQEGNVLVKDISVGATTYEDQTLGAGEYFGERSLATSEPRAANVVALNKGVAFSIDRNTFEKVLGKMSALILKAQDARRLAGVKALKRAKLDPNQISSLAALIEDKRYRADKEIMTQGERTKAALYFVREGRIEILEHDGDADDSDAPLKVIKDVEPGGYFGEAIYRKHRRIKAPYTARVADGKPCVCGVLSVEKSREIFDTGLLVDDGATTKVSKPGDTAVSMAPVYYDSTDESGDEGFMDVESLLPTTLYNENATLSDLQRHVILGEGTFGQVWLVSESGVPADKRVPFALKIQSKRDLVHEGQVKAVIQEKNIMSEVRQHPFLINLVKTYQDDRFVYILLEMIQGGEMFSILHREEESGFDEPQAKFYGLCVADALAYMHRSKIVYRDLKPENIMIDAKGYPIIIDFGFAKHVPEKTYTLCGTPGYLPPEVVMTRGHNCSADHWSFGILVYEMITGENPFFFEGMDQMSLFQAIVKDDFDDPYDSSREATDLVRKLLVKDPTLRLGSLAGGERDILEHPWFSPLDLGNLRFRAVDAPWVPQIKDPFDTSCFDDWSHLEDRTKVQYEPLEEKDAILFKEF